MLPENFLAAEPLIIDRVKAEVSGLAGVMSRVDLLHVRDWTQLAPAVHVLYAGIAVEPSDDDPTLIKVVQSWVLWLCVRNVASGRATEAMRESAGPFLSQLIDTLHGWKPLAHAQRMRLVRSPEPIAARTKDDKFSGAMLFPLVFNLSFPTRGAS